MTTARTFQRGLGSLLGYPEGQMDQRARPLRDLGLLGSGPRGPAALHITPVEAALMLCCVAPMRANDAATIGVAVANLEYVPSPTESDALFKLPDGRRASFAAVLGHLLTQPDSFGWERIEISVTAKMATIFGADGRRLIFMPDAAEAAAAVAGNAQHYNRMAEADCGHFFKLTYAMVAFLGTWLTDPPAAIQKLDARERAISVGHHQLKDVAQLVAELSGRPSKQVAH